MRPTSTPVAVVGASCRLPGGVRSPRQLWDALVAGRDMITDHHPEHPRASILPAGILNDEDQGFDADHFALSPSEVEAMDPQQRMLLELVDEACQDAGLPLASLRGRRVGLWVGSSCLDQALLRLGPGQGGTMVDTAGALPSMLANRVSRHPLCDWTGPSETIDTACSASLVAVHRARQALLLGEVDLAVVAGSNTLMLDTHTRMFRASGVLSTDGRVHPYDQAGSGFVRGEGAAVMVLQRAADVAESGTRARALLVGSMTNCDGAGRPLGSPNPAGQIDLLTRVYGQAGIFPSAVGYVEGHGTGTRAGDSAEGRALGKVLAAGREDDDPLLVGSVKANMGHLEGAAGIVGLLKTVLAVEHGVIPPTIHHTCPPPGLTRLGVQVATTARPWPGRGKRIAGVSAFGFGGTNAHVIVQSVGSANELPLLDDREQVVPLSAGSLTALSATAQRWGPVVSAAESVAQIAGTAAHRRDHLKGARAAIVASSPTEAARVLGEVARGSTGLRVAGPREPEQRPKVVFVYSGHGAHPENGSPVSQYGLEEEPAFVASLAQARAAVREYRRSRGYADPQGMARVQPSQWAWQVAATALLDSWGIAPDVVVGHSLGEIAAAHTCGALSYADAAQIVVERSRLLEETAVMGALLATALTVEQAETLLESWPAVTIAAVNAHASVVLSGPTDALAGLEVHLRDRGVWVRHIADAPPAHSPLVADQATRLPDLISHIQPHQAQKLMWSTCTGRPVTGQDLGPSYWGEQLRGPVLLREVMRSLIDDQPVVVVEIGARAVLATALTDTLTQESRYEVDPPLVTTAGAGPGGSAREHLLLTLAHLYTRGLDPLWPTPDPSQAAELPARAWTHHSSALPEQQAQVVQLHDLDIEQVRAVITAEVTVAVRLVAHGSVRPEHSLSELGLGSLMRAHLHTRIVDRLPDLAGLPTGLVQHATTVAQLADTICEHWSGRSALASRL